MLQNITLFLGGLLAFFLRPRIILLTILSLVLIALTYVLFNEPVAAIAIKQFVTKTLPGWGLYAGRMIARATAKRYVRQILFFTTGLLAFPWLKALFSHVGTYLSDRCKLGIDWWKNLTIRKKIAVVSITLCLLWFPLGTLVIYFIPPIVLKDFLVFTFKPLATRIGFGVSIGVILGKIEHRLVHLVPEGLRYKARLKTKWRVMRKLVRMRQSLARRKTFRRIGKKVKQRLAEAEKKIEKICAPCLPHITRVFAETENKSAVPKQHEREKL